MLCGQLRVHLLQLKRSLKGEEALSSDIVAQAHLEEVGLKLFEYADSEDRKATFHKCVLGSATSDGMSPTSIVHTAQEYGQGFLHIQSHLLNPKEHCRVARRGV